ncbi:MAG TPA: PAS domain-containing sensor histidine kinase, partial [Rhodobacteraceae bacterium]|nr:PAS domain-containing sensor histidine kinase [Paracoccaceae bacterium]
MSFDSLWNALPTPAFLIGPGDLVTAVNPAGEGFMNVSAKSLTGKPCADVIKMAAPLAESLQRVRRTQGPLYINDVETGGRRRKPVRCNIQITPMSSSDPRLLMLVSSRHAAAGGVLNPGAKSAAKSAIGMAEMLAHEIKNPLAGITGAAQLLAMNLEPQ